MNTPRFSVIVPTYNLEAYIAQTLTSVLAQRDAPDFEVLVVDDRSKDCTRAIVAGIAEQDPRVRLLTKPSRLGASGARNTGIGAARGEWNMDLYGKLYELLEFRECRRLLRRMIADRASVKTYDYRRTHARGQALRSAATRLRHAPHDRKAWKKVAACLAWQ